MVKVYLRPDLSGLKEQFIIMAEGLDPLLASGPAVLDVVSKETLAAHNMDADRLVDAYTDSIDSMPVKVTGSGGLQTLYNHQGKDIVMSCPARHPNGQSAAENWYDWLRWRARASVGLPLRDTVENAAKETPEPASTTILSALTAPMP